MKKIEKLTAEQEEKLKEVRKHWFKIGTSTTPADRPRAEKAILKFYELLNKKAPIFVWCDSPLIAEIIINMDKNPDILNDMSSGKDVKLSFTGTWFWGAQESYWISFYLFCAEIGVEYEQKDSEVLNLWAEIAQSCTWFYPFENKCLICERPIEIHMNEKEVLHKDGGASVKFKDGFSVFSLNGIRVPEYIALASGNELDPLKVLGETNVDIRREGLKKIPLEKIISATNAKKLDEWKDTRPWCDYTLYDMDLKDGKVRRVLRMKNPSLENTYHMERVQDDCETVKQALGWRNGQEDYLKPKKEFYERETLT